jgi:hypothetical protein
MYMISCAAYVPRVRRRGGAGGKPARRLALAYLTLATCITAVYSFGDRQVCTLGSIPVNCCGSAMRVRLVVTLLTGSSTISPPDIHELQPCRRSVLELNPHTQLLFKMSAVIATLLRTLEAQKRLQHSLRRAPRRRVTQDWCSKSEHHTGGCHNSLGPWIISSHIAN